MASIVYDIALKLVVYLDAELFVDMYMFAPYLYSISYSMWMGIVWEP